MDIKDGYYATLRNGIVYEAVNYKKDKDNNYKLRSTDPDDLNNGFDKYSDEVFVKTVAENEIKRIERIRTYATLKNDPDRNTFIILQKNDGLDYNSKIVLATTDHALAGKFDFGPCGYGAGTYEKTFDISDVSIKYDKRTVLSNDLKKSQHLYIREALSPIIGKARRVASNKKDSIALEF